MTLGHFSAVLFVQNEHDIDFVPEWADFQWIHYLQPYCSQSSPFIDPLISHGSFALIVADLTRDGSAANKIDDCYSGIDCVWKSSVSVYRPLYISCLLLASAANLSHPHQHDVLECFLKSGWFFMGFQCWTLCVPRPPKIRERCLAGKLSHYFQPCTTLRGGLVAMGRGRTIIIRKRNLSTSDRVQPCQSNDYGVYFTSRFGLWNHVAMYACLHVLARHENGVVEVDCDGSPMDCLGRSISVSQVRGFTTTVFYVIYRWQLPLVGRCSLLLPQQGHDGPFFIGNLWHWIAFLGDSEVWLDVRLVHHWFEFYGVLPPHPHVGLALVLCGLGGKPFGTPGPVALWYSHVGFGDSGREETKTSMTIHIRHYNKLYAYIGVHLRGWSASKCGLAIQFATTICNGYFLVNQHAHVE